MEAEYKALANATAEMVWIQKLLTELRVHHPPIRGYGVIT
jgi:hypothetical protein